MSIKSIIRFFLLTFAFILLGFYLVKSQSFGSATVSFWSLNQNTQDSVGSNNGTINGQVAFVNDYASFTGNGEIDTTSTNIPVGTTPRTFEFDFNTTYSGSNEVDILSYGTGANNQGISMGIISGGKLFLSSWGPAIFTNNLFNDGSWHHSKMQILADGTGKIYIDGVLQASGALNPNTQDTGALYIGRREVAPNSDYIGLLKNVSIIDDSIVALSPTPTPTPTPTRLIGNDSVSNATSSLSTNYLVVEKFQALATGNVNSIRFVTVGSGSIKVGMYSDSSGNPGNLLSQSTNTTSLTAGVNFIPLPSTPVVAGNIYWLAFDISVTGIDLTNFSDTNHVVEYVPLNFGDAFPSTYPSGNVAVRSWDIEIAGYGTGTIVTPTPTPTPSSTINWPQYHYDTAHTGFNPYETILSPSNVGNLTLAWSYGAGGDVTASPTVVNNVAYIGNRGVGKVYAINATTGALIWSQQLGIQISNSVIVDNNIAYVQSNDGNGNLYALNAINGNILWQRFTGNYTDGENPTVANGIVYIGSATHNLYAFNAQTGASIWTFTAGGSFDAPAPAVVNGVVYIGSRDGNLYAIDAVTGTQLWVTQLNQPILTSPVVTNNIVYQITAVTGSANINAINATNGAVLWTTTIGQVNFEAPAVVNGMLYVGSYDGYMYALNTTTGELVWKSHSDGGNIADSSPAVANGVVYIGGGDDHEMFAFDAITGARLWTYPIGNATLSSPAVVNGTVYIGVGGSLLAFNLGSVTPTPTATPTPTPTPVLTPGLPRDATWMKIPNSPASSQIVSDPTDATVLYAASPFGNGIFKSYNAGVTWVESDNGISTANGQTKAVISISIAPNNSNILYAGTAASTFGGTNARIYKSIDAGAHWTDITNNLTSPYDPSDIAIDPTDPNIVYIAFYGNCMGLWKSTDGGNSWTRKPTNCDTYRVVIDPQDHNTIYYGGNVLYRSVDGGDTWTTPGNNQITNIGAVRGIAIDPTNNAIIYIGTERNSIYKSTDTGNTWTLLSTGPAGQVAQAMLLDLDNSSAIYLGTQCPELGCSVIGMYRSYDGGSTWSNFNFGDYPQNIRYLLIPQKDHSHLYATTASGIYVYGEPLPQPPNQAPVITVNNNATVINAGDTWTADGSFSDADSNAWTGTVDYGDGSGIEPLPISGMNFTLSHQYNTYGNYTITVRVTDNQGATGSKTTIIYVNGLPTANAGGPYAVDEGSMVGLVGSGTDPDGDALTYQWDLNNDGIYDTTGATSVYSAVDGPASKIAVLQVCDNDNLCATSNATIDIANVAPTIGTITAPTSPTQINTAVNTSATFTDPGVLDTHTALWDWGDNTTSSGSISESNGSGSVTGSHVYSAAGVYTVSVTVTDKDNGSATKEYQYVVIYDPTGGYVTGGGTITSPLGAEPASSTATGKATFGFSAKYNSGTTPTGNTKFIFPKGGFDFASTAYDWLVVSGATVYLEGHGTINGAGNYTFLLSAIDGSPDNFRIKITDLSGTTIYDNQIGTDGITPPTQAIDSGQITVH